VALFFSLNYLISKLGMRQFAPLSFAWLRVAGSAIILHFVARTEGAALAPEDRRPMLLFSLLAVVINQSMFLGGLSLTTVPVAAILITTIPVFALGVAIVLGRERMTAPKAIGIALGCAGALLVVGGESLHASWRSFAGAAMIVVNCLSYATYLVVSKPIMSRLSARTVVARMFAYGAILLLPVSAWSLAHEQWSSITPQAWLALGLVIAGPTVAAYLINAWSLRYAESSVVAAYTYLQPVLATALGAIFLHEHIRPMVLVAGAMIAASASSLVRQSTTMSSA
jgi:drug/metabolite transporter (DMT)-like permease